MNETDALTWYLAELTARTSDTEVTAAELRTAGRPFAALGMGSLSQLRLIDEVERIFDVTIDFAEDAADLGSLVGCLRRQGVCGPPADGRHADEGRHADARKDEAGWDAR